MARLLLRQGRLIDPAAGLDRVADLLIADGKVAAIDPSDAPDAEVVDCQERLVLPGLVDLHAQFREPGHEEDESIETGVAAAIAGGFTTVCVLPNTDPPIDTQASVEFVRQKAARAEGCRVEVLACVSRERRGEELSEMGALVEAGAVGFTDAMRPIHNPELLRRALQYTQMFDKPVLNHPEMLELSRGGVMHDGDLSLLLGLPGLPAEAEDVMAARDIRLAESTGGRLHLVNVSTAGSVDLIRRAKARGVRVTAAVAVMNLALTDQAFRSFDANVKLNPPLRGAEHRTALLEGLRDGTLDAIVSGHSPRAREKKMLTLDLAPFGASTLDTTFALVAEHVVDSGWLDWPTAIAKLTSGPAYALGLADRGSLEVGRPADVAIVDPQALWTVAPEQFRSRSANTPLLGKTLRGRVTGVLVGGHWRLRETPAAA